MGVFYQATSAATVCSLNAIMGILFAFPSSTMKLFESANTTLHRPMDETELALFGSLSSIGAVISTPPAGLLLDIVGRKYCVIVAALINVMAWSLLTTCKRVEVALVSMFLSGVSGYIFLVVPVYVSEFCQESIRGMMTSGTMLFYYIGILLSYLLGGYLSYNAFLYVGLSLSVAAVVLIGFVKESPLFLLRKRTEEEAKKSLAYFRNTTPDSKEVLEEISNMRRILNPEMDDLTPEEEKLQTGIESKEKLSLWQFIRKSRSTRQGLFVALTLCTASIFQGLVAIQVYAEPLFLEAVPNLSPTVSCIILALVSVVVGVFAAYLIDMFGRRPLMIYASLASAVCCILIGTQLQLHWGPHWMTALFIYAFCITYTAGAGTVPYVLFAEIFLPEVKSFMSMLVIEWAWLCNFIILFIFNPLVTLMGLGPMFYGFAVVCLATVIFSLIYQPETKGLPVDVIQTLLAPRKRGVRS